MSLSVSRKDRSVFSQPYLLPPRLKLATKTARSLESSCLRRAIGSQGETYFAVAFLVLSFLDRINADEMKHAELVSIVGHSIRVTPNAVHSAKPVTVGSTPAMK